MSKLISICLLFICFFVLKCKAQNKLFTTIDSQTNEAIPFVNIISVTGNYRTVSDSLGNFIIKEQFEKDTLLLTSLAYESKKMSVKDLLGLKNGKVSLKYKTYVLNTFNTVADVAKQYLIKAINNIPKNYNRNEFVISSNYLQYHIENNKAVRLIESRQDIAYTAVANKRHVRVKINNIRRSDNNELNSEKHGDHLFDVLLEDPIVHSEGTILNKKALDYYSCQLDTIQNPDSLIKILFKSMNYNQDHIYSGFVTLNKKDFAVVSYHCDKKNNPYATVKRQHFSAPYTWQFTKGSKTYNYQKINGNYYLKNTLVSYKHKLINAQNGNIDYSFEEYFELICKDELCTGKNTNTFRNYSGLYGLHYKYNKEDWTDSNFKNLSDKIISDLISEKEMEQQFKNNE